MDKINTKHDNFETAMNNINTLKEKETDAINDTEKEENKEYRLTLSARNLKLGKEIINECHNYITSKEYTKYTLDNFIKTKTANDFEDSIKWVEKRVRNDQGPSKKDKGFFSSLLAHNKLDHLFDSN